jgi:heat shock protein HslJ
MNWKTLTLLITLVFMTACVDNNLPDEPIWEIGQPEQENPREIQADDHYVDNELVEGEWVLQSLEGEALIEGTNIILAFDETSFSGFGGCNGYGGPYRVNEHGEITFIEYSSQAEGCIEPEGVLDQELNYMQKLMRTKRYQVNGAILSLSIREDDKELIYYLRESFVVDPEQLNDTSWQLLKSKGFPLITDSKITISFLDGEMEGFAGCRDYRGEYRAEGDLIRFPMTMMVGEICQGEDLRIQEGKFTTALELASHYQILDDELHLFLVSGEELTFARIK